MFIYSYQINNFMGKNLDDNFDGKASPQRETYVGSCSGGGINLHLYKMGHYKECSECETQQTCQDRGNVAGEQASL
jgi:hypothetical protein